jgi:hypothetical protein
MVLFYCECRVRKLKINGIFPDAKAALGTVAYRVLNGNYRNNPMAAYGRESE